MTEESDAMTDFRTFRNTRRRTARPGAPVVDPAGWMPETLARDDGWIYRLSDAEISGIRDGIAAVRKRGLAIVDMKPGDFPLGRFADIVADVRNELRDGRGIVMLRGLPVAELGIESAALAYFGIGTHLGSALRQNAKGHVLGHVKDLGGDYNDPKTRGYLTRAEMRFHCDHSDYVGLLCLHQSKSGGESRIASSVTVYNRILEQRPDLVRELCADWYWTKHGQVSSADETPWFKAPIFMFEQGVFSARGLGAYVLKSQGLPGVPPFTDAQKEAIRIYEETVEASAVDIGFEPGDIQLLNNHVMLHTRRAFEDWPEPHRKRHLLRLWLTDPEARILPAFMREGMLGEGVALDGVTASAPLDADAA
jgi:hypothetical protein